MNHSKTHNYLYFPSFRFLFTDHRCVGCNFDFRLKCVDDYSIVNVVCWRVQGILPVFPERLAGCTSAMTERKKRHVQKVRNLREGPGFRKQRIAFQPPYAEKVEREYPVHQSQGKRHGQAYKCLHQVSARGQGRQGRVVPKVLKSDADFLFSDVILQQ